jgi:hypothetical protein
VDAVWHFSVARWPRAEMLIGPGVGGGVAWWRNAGYFDVCRDPIDGGARDDCGGPFGRVLFHWSMLFHPYHFDVFAEPGLVIAAGIPGVVGLDWDMIGGVRFYF